MTLLQVKGYKGPSRKILIDVGTKDDFLENQLKPDVLAKAAPGTPVSVDLRLQVRAAAQCAIDKAAVSNSCISPQDLRIMVQIEYCGYGWLAGWLRSLILLHLHIHRRPCQPCCKGPEEQLSLRTYRHSQ